ncbi:DNA-3-methyladenine glycosylase [Paenibacillus puerhi]|uniref:DNA-3-methyladenine glycosylase n=1 Tax=Paenibacillus puerhi TaxID=2692622 RepID=UPI00135B6176|nr:DNA-3-methyladenine glycosylase [Paenibacillus puerhi]
MNRHFFEQDTVWVAEQLIGCYLVRQTDEGIIRVQITETEAYKGAEDPASHAYRGMTPRSRLMFGEVGRLYIYFIYGKYFCMNVVAHEPGMVGAVLIRGARPVEGMDLIRANRPNQSDKTLLNGPAKLTQGLNITKDMNGYDLLADPNNCMTWLQKERNLTTVKTKRIGISKGTDLLWRFLAVDP